MLNLNWEKIHSIILFVTCHDLRNFPHTHTHPLIYYLWIFETLRVIIFWVRVTHKMLNLNWDPPHPIILFDTCHSLRNFHPTHTHPLHDPPHPTPSVWVLTHPTLPHPTPSWPTPPHPTPSWPTHPTPPHPTLQPQNKGSGMLWGQSYVLPMTCRGVEALGPPFSRHAALWLFHWNVNL